MKKNVLLWMIMHFVFYGKAQIVSYAELICTANEIVWNDSLHFKNYPTDMIVLDTNLAKQVFAPLYHTADNRKGCKVRWGVAGKISKQPLFDLLLLVEKNDTDNSTWHHVLHLVSMDKHGHYIASFGLYINHQSRYNSYFTSACLYPDLSIIQFTKVKAGQQEFAGSNKFSLQSDGKFVHSGKN